MTDYINENKNELKIERLISSDLPRAIQTAKPISKTLNLKIEYTPEFRETNNGVFAGMPNDIANENVILVTHGGVINVIYSLIDGTPFSNKVESERISHATMIPLKCNNGIWIR